MGEEMSVVSKFAPTYTMTLNLLRNRTVEEAESLLERSFGQFQNLQRTEHWVHRERNLEERLADLSARVYRHPRVRCTERTLVQYLREETELEAMQARLRRARRENWRDGRRGRYGSRAADPGQRTEAMRRQLKELQSRHHASPCLHCPYLVDHRANHLEIASLHETLEGGEEELRQARERYRIEFHAFRAVLHEAGFLENDRPTRLGALAAALYGESALIVAQAIEGSWFDDLEPAELAATLVMLVAEDRGRDHGPVRRHFPTPRVEQGWRTLRSALHHLSVLEQAHHMETLRPLSLDYVAAAYHWTEGVPLSDIEPPAGADVGDVIKAVKNLYSMLRQVEQVTRTRPVHGLIAATRDRLERDLIRRI
jgi:superfamily II RNA helicase